QGETMNAMPRETRWAGHACACLIFTLLCTCVAVGALAQGSPTKQAGTTLVLPAQAAKMAESIQASFYHPDELAGLDCRIAVDWASIFKSGGLNAAQTKALAGLQLKVHSLRD